MILEYFYNFGNITVLFLTTTERYKMIINQVYFYDKKVTSNIDYAKHQSIGIWK